jgi:hypothetical protein
MNRLAFLFALALSPLAFAQTRQQVSAPADPPQSSSTERTQAIRSARTLCIESQTVFLTVSTMERALMKQKNWDRLGLHILAGCSADLRLDINRLHFTHIHTYVLTDRATGIVLAADRVRAFDGVVASGPIAGQIVKILTAARLPAHPVAGN